MSEPGHLLDLPEEPARTIRGVPAAVIGVVVVVVGGVILARTLALGGTTRPWLSVQAALALPAMIVAWLLVGPHQWRTGLTVAAMTLGLVLQPLATSGATPSPARLAQTVDSLGLPGDNPRDVYIGNARCRPACSELRRTTVARGISYAKARARVEGLMRVHGFKVRMYGHRAGAPERIDAESDDLLVQFELRQVALGETRVASVWLPRGPTPDTEVG